MRSSLFQRALACAAVVMVNLIALAGNTFANQLTVTVAAGSPNPNPVATGRSTSTTFQNALSAPQAVQRELQRNGASQQYTIQLETQAGVADGEPVSVTFQGSTLTDNGRIGDFNVNFDRTNHRITIATHRNSALLASVAAAAKFSTAGVRRIKFDGSAVISGVTYNDNDGGRALVTVIDLHLRADTNRDGSITAADDATARRPGLYVPLNGDDDNSTNGADNTETAQIAGENDLREAKMVISPVKPANQIVAGDIAYVKLSRSATCVRVWRTSDKSQWNGNTPRVVVSSDNTYDLTAAASRASYEHDKDSLWIEGFAAGSGTLILEAMDSSNTVILSDDLVVNIWSVEIEVANTATPDDDIVCRRSTNPAGRPEVECRLRIVGGAPGMTLHLDNAGTTGTGQLRFGTTAGNVTAQNLTLNNVAANTWTAFRVSGETESAAMYDAIIRARETNSTGAEVGRATATVLWVDLSLKNGRTQTLSPDNSRILTAVANQSNGANCGPSTMANDGRIGWVFEVKGDVKPAAFNQNITLGRDIEARWYSP